MSLVRSVLVGLLVWTVLGCSAGSAATAPAQTAAAPSSAPVPTKRPARPTEAAHAPLDATIDGIPAKTLSLGTDAAPIDVTFAFGSIWVANHHKNTVVRLDPESMATQATIPVGQGPGWFVVMDDTIWVSEQLGHGLTRIDPATNAPVSHVGSYATCGRGVAALGQVWQPACDAHQIMRIDPATNHSVDVSSGDANSLVLADTVLIASGPAGLARIDPSSGALTPIGGPAGWAQGYDGKTIWVAADRELYRVRPADGKVLASVPIAKAGTLLFNDGSAWVTTEGPELHEVDMSTNTIVRTIHVDPWPTSLVFGSGALWITDFERSSLIRLDV